MDTVLTGLLVAQAVSVIGVAFKAWFAFGKLVATVETIDRRVTRLETVFNGQRGG